MIKQTTIFDYGVDDPLLEHFMGYQINTDPVTSKKYIIVPAEDFNNVAESIVKENVKLSIHVRFHNYEFI